MGDLTKDMPKCMLQVAGKPILQHTLECLKIEGIDQVVINLHHKAAKVVDYFGMEWQGTKIKYVYEQKLLGTAGAVRNARHLLMDSEPFLVIYGDVLYFGDYQCYIKRHAERKATATILYYQGKSNSNIITNQWGQVAHFYERPEEPVFGKVNTGIYICSHEIFKWVPDGFCDFPAHVFQQPEVLNHCYADEIEGYRIAVDTPARLCNANKDLGVFPWKK
jgi:mannose-1-phosphate guanylyltransferase/phosphomannomutase